MTERPEIELAQEAYSDAQVRRNHFFTRMMRSHPFRPFHYFKMRRAWMLARDDMQFFAERIGELGGVPGYTPPSLIFDGEPGFQTPAEYDAWRAGQRDDDIPF